MNNDIFQSNVEELSSYMKPQYDCVVMKSEWGNNEKYTNTNQMFIENIHTMW